MSTAIAEIVEQNKAKIEIENERLRCLEGVLSYGDPDLLLKSEKIKEDTLPHVDAEIEKIINDLTEKLNSSPYIALAAPQFGIRKRLIVIGSPREGKIEDIPEQVWVNPEIEPASDDQVPDCEVYATNIEQRVLVSCYAAIRVSGWRRWKGDPKFERVDNLPIDGWLARAFQALDCYFNGRLPEERVLHPFFNKPREEYLRDWQNMVPFRIRPPSQNKSPTLDVYRNLRSQLQPIIDKSWEKNPAWHDQTCDLVGFLHKNLTDFAVARDLPRLLARSFTEPAWEVHEPGDLVKLYRIDLTDNMLSCDAPSANLVGSVDTVDSFYNLTLSGNSLATFAHHGGLHNSAPTQGVDMTKQSSVPPLIAEGQATFRKALKSLLKDHPGEWVAYSGVKQVGLGDSKRALYQRCLDEGLKPGEFVVRWISPDSCDYSAIEDRPTV